jgi:hypothetical protein
MPNPPRGTSNQSLNFWAMMNNVIISALVKGQLLPVLLFFIIIVIILKMPFADVSRLAFSILADLEKGWLLGYVLSAGAIGGWQWQVRWQRRKYETRLRDMAKARDEAQEHALPGLLESSIPGKLKGKKKK